jgi:4-hydroxy-tetrahydrodipicolinate reductase
MRIGIIGYGKMGKTIEKIAKERGHVISSIIDVTNQSEINDQLSLKTEVLIEFTTPDNAVNNLKKGIDLGIPVVCGTTGWLNHFAEIQDYCKEKKGTVFYASNYSLGVNIFFKLNEELAKMMSRFDEYTGKIEEIHHTEKKDKPSGTAITLAEGLIRNHINYTKWISGESKVTNDLPVFSYREHDVPGTHTVTYKSEFDTIEIKHTANSRKGFALGAVMVAEWIKGKKGFLGMNDYLKF